MSALVFCEEKERTSVQTHRITKMKARPSIYIQTCLQKTNGTEASQLDDWHIN
jgi:hypothetical protein